MTIEKGKRPTLKDVAALAGVDASLVSRVMTKDPGLSIPESTRQRVLDAVAAVNYRPSAAARGLRTQKLSTLGLVIPNLANPIYAPIAMGAQARASQAGFALLLASDTGSESSSVAHDIVRMLAEDRVDGLLVASGDRNSELLRMLRDVAKPVVLVNRALRGIPSATVDDATGALVATRHLIERGHRRIAHLAGPLGVDTTVRRTRGFERALAESGLDGPAPMVNADDWGAMAGYRSGLDLLSSAPDVTAVFAENVNLAVGMYRAAHERGMRIPDDLSVIAMHDYDLAAVLVPSLTTVAMSLRELGDRAVELLLGILDGRPAQNVLVKTPPVIVERGSVAAR